MHREMRRIRRLACPPDAWLTAAAPGVTGAAWAPTEFAELPPDLTPANCRWLHALRLLCCVKPYLALPAKLGDASHRGLARDGSR